jgi:MOSC domain-containing protein YiiM
VLLGHRRQMTHGLLIAINTSDGGVPKRPRAEAFVGANGIDGDRQRDLRHHGGPHRAVCLYSYDLIRALQHEGHTLSVGSLGENLTLRGVDWTRMTPGTCVEIGPVRLRLTDYAVPCRNLSSCFAGGQVTRIAQPRHTGWSRIYARVETPGTVQIGDLARIVTGEPVAVSAPSATAESRTGRSGTGVVAAFGAFEEQPAATRVTRTASFEIDAPLAKVFPLFTPDGERLWVADWEPAYLHPQSGEQVPGAIFTTSHGGEETLWLIRELSSAAGIAEYVRSTPGSRIGTVRVVAREVGPRPSTQVSVTYDMTARSAVGRSVLAAVTAEAFADMIADWRQRVAHALGGDRH